MNVDIRNCSRCGGDHPGLAFARFGVPVEPADHLYDRRDLEAWEKAGIA